ncbi:DNA-directed RNA polymerase sigma-70 factor [Haloferula helveola]|uniref:DNA-directed RNA polymerase sigma-70 factor n=1 Tax=Haloferula helveola TaxID=490095 RepID=A0ABM7RI43_9BACT|nr:DNA-directed RNA polymerase sigma-70 factor [Haloferula helveola]
MGRRSATALEFNSLLINHQEVIRAYIITQIPGSPDVRDILQEVNIVLWEKQKAFRRGSNFGAWACTVARYKVLEHLRKESRLRGLLVFNDELSEDLATEMADRMPSDIEEKRQALDYCLSSLSAPHRRLLEARYHRNGNQMGEIAEETGRTRESLRVTLSRIRGVLRECVRGRLGHEGGAG